MSAEWWTAIGTILLAIVAAFQDHIRRFFLKPKLSLAAKVAPPDCHKTSWKQNYLSQDASGVVLPRVRDLPCYYFRLEVTNKGNTEAHYVELFASQLSRQRADGTFEVVPSFFPMNLMWAHVRKPFLDVLSPEIPKMCDLAHVLHPDLRKQLGHDLPDVPKDQAILAFDLQVEPNTKGHLIGDGTYRLAIILGAANCAPKNYTLEIKFPGEWYDDERKMLSDGFGMRIL